MPQQTNLNVAPYFDDFDATNDYHKVLFKPGFPVQARELTTLQSILQNQIERFGQHFFKEGSKVIPGNTGYSQIYYCVQLENVYQGVPVSAYADQLVGTKITGQSSGVTAFVDSVLFPEDSERGNLTLYVNYLNSSTTNNSTQIFSDGESLICNESLSSGLLGNTTIAPGTPLATTLAASAATTGSSFQIESGIYFIRGNFVNVNKEVLILDQYSTTPNYRIGLLVEESVITSDLDEELNDNSQGFNNYAAPGADRLRISVRLTKKALNDFNDDNFILLATVINGVLQIEKKKKVYGTGGVGYDDLTDALARRTFDESGHYYVKPFQVSVVNSLNDRVGNDGIFNAGQFSPAGTTVSDNLALYKISPGKAYVHGYEIDSTNAVYLDVDKPRTTRTLENQNIIYNTGPTLKLNRVYRNPTVGLGNTYFVSLRDQRVGSDQESAPGNEVGIARVYDFRLNSGSYNISDGNLNEWDLALYDIQTNVNVSINEAHTLSTPTFVKGASSGATGFLRNSVSDGTALTLYETEGSFVVNERLIFNGVDNGRIAIAVTEHSISDVKSVYGMNGYDGDSSSVGINTFSADVIQSTKFTVGIATVSSLSGGISTVRSNNPLFPGSLVKENDLIEYTDNTTAGLLTEDPIVARVVSVGTTHIDIESVTAVTGISSNILPTASLNTTDFKILTTKLSASSDDSLFTTLPKVNVADVTLDNASLSIRKTFDVTISSNKFSTQIVAGTNETFLPFDEERYLLIRDDGTTEALNSSQLDITSDGKELQIRGLGSDGGATLIATLKKIKPKAKQKIKNRVSSIIIDKSKLVGSGIGTTTLNNGLTYGSFPFGTRVEDEVISLNTADVIQIHGIYESADTAAASCPQVILQSINTASTTTQELLVGERFVGQTSGSVGIIAEKLNNSSVSFIYKNEIALIEGETIEFEESVASALVSEVTTPSFNVSSNYSFQTGQEKTIYDYGRIRRKPDSVAPNKQLKIYFMSASYSSTDDGDITTVNSYNQFNYASEIKDVDLYRNSDIIDIRPRVSDFVTANTNTRSPLEFLGRSYNGSGQSATNPLASDEAILSNISYYQGRIDRVYLTKDGRFQVVYGAPSDSPDRPDPIEDALEICTVKLPPFLYENNQASLSFMQYKRYQMQDIKKLEDRINSLEYYTTLSLLEKETANLFISDESGLNRFKAGFFVDNFNDFQAQENNIRINNAIDRKYNELRPRHYTNSVDLVFGPVVDVDPTADLNFSDIEANNIRKENDVLTLDYSEVEFIRQNFATRTESVTPFLISFWNGTIELTPSSDNWIDTTRLEPKIIEAEGNYNEVFRDQVEAGTIDPQTGFGPVIWNSWQTHWSGVETTTSTSTRVIENGPSVIHQGESWRPGQMVSTRTVTDQVIQDQFRTTRQRGTSTRSGVRTIVTETFDQESVGDRVVSRDLVPYMRSRNVEFVSKKMKPLTRMYGFFDGVNITEYCVPKLLEIAMTSGTFQVGETVIGEMQTIGIGEAITKQSNAEIRFRVAQHNHREGPYNAPTKTYVQNPYLNIDLSSSYSSTSTILNVDTFSLASQARGDFYGWVKPGMVLVGQTSGAIATIEDVRLISDLSATLIGSYYIPNPNNITFPRFEAGTKTFTLTNDIDNDQDNASTIAEESFTSSGTLETVQENIISVRNARLELRNEFQSRNVSRDLGTQLVSSTVVSSRSRTQTVITYYDPLAQSFLVEDETGVFLTSCDVFFRSKDDMDIPVVFQLRTMKNGSPTARILPFSEIVLDPNDIQTSSDGSVATNIRFKAPVYCEGGTEYAICLASNSTKYSVYISRIGENDLLSDTFISNQPYLGSLFKSQNASTWEPSQWEDLKFTLYRADFIENGSVEFYSPELTRGNAQIAKLTPNPIALESRSIRVGLGTTVADSYEFGNTVFQAGTNATGDIVGTAGSAVNLSISNAGLGYTPADGGQTFTGVNLVTLTGQGRGATADITIVNGSIVASGATINNAGGAGYQVGDVVGIDTIGAASVGRNARLTISGIGHTNELIINNVQGEFVVGAAKTLFFVNSSGISTELNSSGSVGLGTGGDVQITNIQTESDGLHFKVNHQNHGMYFSDNSVSISGVLPDIKPTKLTAEYSFTSTSQIAVGSATTFSTFENVGVGTTNPGYLLIGDEIIEYTNVSGNSIGGDIVRGNNPKTYPVGTPVYKYELGGINLNRINRTHSLSEVTKLDPFTFDSYQVKIDTSSTTGTDRSTDVGFPKLYINGNKSTGGSEVRASQNMPFEIITPQVQNVTVPGTSITAELRTTTSQSFSGTETPFKDAGFQDITINQKNYFDTPRMIASKVNEDEQLIDIPGNKSMQMRLFLNTTDTRISPVIDSQRVNAILTSNRVNDVISNYATDSRVNSALEDPTAFQYLSKEIVLENPASSIKVIVSAHIHEGSDIRAFFATNNKPGLAPIFTPFPGYANLNAAGEIIAPEDNNGESDSFITKANNLSFDSKALEYKEYTFTIDKLPSFRTYRVKLGLTSNSQCFVPRIKELRVIALA